MPCGTPVCRSKWFVKYLGDGAEELARCGVASDLTFVAVGELGSVGVLHAAHGGPCEGVAGDVHRLLYFLLNRVANLRAAGELEALAEGFGGNCFCCFE